MPDTHGFSAWISIDGVQLPRYGVEAEVLSGEEVMSCWIASEVGKKFAVNYSLPAYPKILSTSVSVDGSGVGGFNHRGKASIKTLSYKYVSPTSARPLVFSRMELTDDETHLGLNLKDLGEIRLQIWTARSITVSTYNGTGSSNMLTKIHERSKKAISHRVSLGEEFTVAPSSFSHTQREQRIMTFVFKYRPREYLQAEGIMPLDPKPDRLRPEKRTADVIEPSDSEDDQEKELQRKEEELQSQLALIRAKRAKKKVKMEPVADPRVKSEVIDLT